MPVKWTRPIRDPPVIQQIIKVKIGSNVPDAKFDEMVCLIDEMGRTASKYFDTEKVQNVNIVAAEKWRRVFLLLL